MEIIEKEIDTILRNAPESFRNSYSKIKYRHTLPKSQRYLIKEIKYLYFFLVHFWQASNEKLEILQAIDSRSDLMKLDSDIAEWTIYIYTFELLIIDLWSLTDIDPESINVNRLVGKVGQSRALLCMDKETYRKLCSLVNELKLSNHELTQTRNKLLAHKDFGLLGHLFSDRTAPNIALFQSILDGIKAVIQVTASSLFNNYESFNDYKSNRAKNIIEKLYGGAA